MSSVIVCPALQTVVPNLHRLPPPLLLGRHRDVERGHSDPEGAHVLVPVDGAVDAERHVRVRRGGLFAGALARDPTVARGGAGGGGAGGGREGGWET